MVFSTMTVLFIVRLGFSSQFFVYFYIFLTKIQFLVPSSVTSMLSQGEKVSSRDRGDRNFSAAYRCFCPGLVSFWFKILKFRFFRSGQNFILADILVKRLIFLPIDRYRSPRFRFVSFGSNQNYFYFVQFLSVIPKLV